MGVVVVVIDSNLVHGVFILSCRWESSQIESLQSLPSFLPGRLY